MLITSGSQKGLILWANYIFFFCVFTVLRQLFTVLRRSVVEFSNLIN